MFVPLTEFAPDADPTTGSLTDVLNVDPTTNGYKGSPAPSSIGVAALAAACTGGALVRTIDGTTSVFAGTSTAIYKLNSTTWEDVTRATAYTAGYRWRFAQFGNYTYAVNRSDATQYYLHGTSTDFADQADTPKARIVFSINDFLFLLGTNEATYGDQPDRWWCSAIGDSTKWVPSIATQSATGRLYDSPGPFTAGHRLSDYAVLFKERAIYVGSYAGPPSIWSWTRVSDIIGASSQEAVQNIGQALLFANKDGIYSFDGATVSQLSAGRIDNWFRGKLDQNNADKIVSVHDRNTKIVRWFFPVPGGGGALTTWVSYNYRSNKFGYGETSIEAALDYATPNMDYAGLAARYPTYADLPDAPYNSSIFMGGSEAPAVFNTSHVFCTLDGNTVSSRIVVEGVGQDGAMTLVKRIRNRYLTKPTTATVTNYYADQLGATYTRDAITTESSGKFDLLRTARWHKFKLETAGSFEMTGADVTAVSAGAE